MWFCDCPSFDQGKVSPLVTSEGCVVLMCDSGGEVWLRPGDVVSSEPFYPSRPDWTVVCCISVEPGTTRWATDEDLEGLDWDVELRGNEPSETA